MLLHVLLLSKPNPLSIVEFQSRSDARRGNACCRHFDVTAKGEQLSGLCIRDSDRLFHAQLEKYINSIENL